MDEKLNFLKLEEEAGNLLENLEKLKNEIKSYETAKIELHLVRENLLEIVDKTGELLSNSSKSLETIIKIGGPEILEKLNSSENKFEIATNKIHNLAKQTRIFVFATLGVSAISLIIGIIALTT